MLKWSVVKRTPVELKCLRGREIKMYFHLDTKCEGFCSSRRKLSVRMSTAETNYIHSKRCKSHCNYCHCEAFRMEVSTELESDKDWLRQFILCRVSLRKEDRINGYSYCRLNVSTVDFRGSICNYFIQIYPRLLYTFFYIASQYLSHHLCFQNILVTHSFLW